MTIYCDTIETPLGSLIVQSDGSALRGVWFVGQKHFPPELEDAHPHSSLEIFMQTRAWFERYFKGENPGFVPAIDPQGTPFQSMVWNELSTISYGQLITYGALAFRIAQQTGLRCSARAVGGAVGRNPLTIMVPCHRVVGAQGKLTGYAGGLDKKVALLTLEGCSINEQNTKVMS